MHLPVLRSRLALGLLIVLAAACGGSTSAGDGVATAPSSESTSTAAPTVAPSTTAPPAPTTTATTAPSPTTAPPAPTTTPPEIELSIVGDEEIVFDWTVDRCEDDAIPDLAVRAIRDVDENVQLYLGNTNGYRMVGPDLDAVEPECTAVSRSTLDADPARFTDTEWLASLHTDDGETIYALVHNEYQGHQHAGQCPQQEYLACWFNAITMKVSTDGGESYSYIAEPPGHHVASLPLTYEAGLGATGLRAPSNIITGPDGFFYSFINAAGVNSTPQWVCLMRTDTVAEPTSWRFWDGSGFEGRFINPYTEPTDTPAAHECQPLDQADIGHALNDSVTYNTALDRYVLIGVSADQIDGREVWGWYYSFSTDLIDWDRRKLLVEMPLPWTVNSPGSDLSYLYPSLLDPDSTSRTFETTDLQAYVYMTRNNAGHASLDRDLVRVPVEFSVDEE